MALSGRPRPPRVPTLPQGETVARYDTYLAAQHAVDHLADKEFPVENVTIVGTDLQMVERVLSRLSYSRVALGGALSGAWFGLFVGLLFSLMGASGQPLLFPAVFIGAGFGMLFSVIGYSFSRGRRDFTSSSQIVAAHYALLCSVEFAHRARMLLEEVGGVVRGGPVAPPAPPPADAPSGADLSGPGGTPPPSTPEVPSSSVPPAP